MDLKMELLLCLLTCLIYQTVALVLLPNCELSGCDERPFRCNTQRRGCVEYRIKEKPGTFIYLKGITTNETRLIIDNIYGLRVKFISPQQDTDHICDIFNIKDVSVIMDGNKSICAASESLTTSMTTPTMRTTSTMSTMPPTSTSVSKSSTMTSTSVRTTTSTMTPTSTSVTPHKSEAAHEAIHQDLEYTDAATETVSTSVTTTSMSVRTMTSTMTPTSTSVTPHKSEAASETLHQDAEYIDDETIISIAVPSSVAVFILASIMAICYKKRHNASGNETAIELLDLTLSPPRPFRPPATPPDYRAPALLDLTHSPSGPTLAPATPQPAICAPALLDLTLTPPAPTRTPATPPEYHAPALPRRSQRVRKKPERYSV